MHPAIPAHGIGKVDPSFPKESRGCLAGFFWSSRRNPSIVLCNSSIHSAVNGVPGLQIKALLRYFVHRLKAYLSLFRHWLISEPETKYTSIH